MVNFQHEVIPSRTIQNFRPIDWESQSLTVNQSPQNYTFIPKMEETNLVFSSSSFIPSPPVPQQLTNSTPPMMVTGYPGGFYVGGPTFRYTPENCMVQDTLSRSTSAHPGLPQYRPIPEYYPGARTGYYEQVQLLHPPTQYTPHSIGSVSMSMVNPSSASSVSSDGQWQPTSIHPPDSPAHRSTGDLVSWSGSPFDSGDSHHLKDYDIVSLTDEADFSEEEDHSTSNALSLQVIRANRFSSSVEQRLTTNALSLQVSRTHSINSTVSRGSSTDTYPSSNISSPGRLTTRNTSSYYNEAGPGLQQVATGRSKRVVKPRAASNVEKRTVMTRRKKAPNMRIPPAVPEIGLTKKTRGRHAHTDPELIESAVVHVCPISTCGACFRRREHVKRHVRGIHTDEKVIQSGCEWDQIPADSPPPPLDDQALPLHLAPVHQGLQSTRQPQGTLQE